MIVLGYNGALLGYPERTGTGHDSSAAIVVDGELVAACEEERFNREKHSAKFPEQAMAFCLKQAGLKSLEEVDLVTYYWSCGLMFRQDMLTQNRAGLGVNYRSTTPMTLLPLLVSPTLGLTVLLRRTVLLRCSVLLRRTVLLIVLLYGRFTRLVLVLLAV